MRHIFTPTGIATIKKTKNVDEDMKKLESYTCMVDM